MNVLFARSDSHYKNYPNLEVFDADRNALSCKDETASIYHPPCRAWGQLKHFAKPRPGERKLAIWSLLRINKFGGVLEHPANSELFKKYYLLMNKGFVLDLEQVWFGHKARKPTKLYIVGIDRSELPHFKKIATEPTHQITWLRGKTKNGLKQRRLPGLEKKDREGTPPLFADYLIKICDLIEEKKNKLGYLKTQGQRVISYV
jgi:hypothetical protein